MSTCPPLIVPAPPADTYVGGLFSAATFPETSGDPHWQCGVEWEITNCARPGAWAETCPPDVPDNKPQDFVPAWQNATPFHVILGVDCSLPGNTLDDFRRRLIANMQAGAQSVVERIYWTGEQGNTPYLAGPAYDGTPPKGDDDVEVLSATPLTVTGGVAALESYLGANYNGIGVIHAPAGLAPFADRNNLVHGNVGGPLRTILGTRWAFGRGYEVNTGPGGIDAPDGTAWMYATGRVAIWQSPIFIPNDDDLQASFDRRSNEVNMFAEQTFIVGHECVLAAVPVIAGCDC